MHGLVINAASTVIAEPFTSIAIVDAIIVDNFIVVLDAVVVQAGVTSSQDDVIACERDGACPRNGAVIVNFIDVIAVANSIVVITIVK